MYELLDKQQRKALILNFTKMKNEDEFVTMDEKEIFKSFDFTAHSAALADEVSIELKDNNKNFPEEPAEEGIFSPIRRKGEAGSEQPGPVIVESQNNLDMRQVEIG